MQSLSSVFLNESMTPHGFCLLWDPWLVWTHIASDAAIALAYFSIPAALWIVAYRRPDLNAYRAIEAFGLFIILCALTHAVGVATIWWPLYGVSAVLKALTAIVSIVTAGLIWRMLDGILRTPKAEELALAVDELRRLNTELEDRVQERTRKLAMANQHLVQVAMEAREAEQTKNGFLAQVSHELRTPLNAIIGFTDLMKSGISGTLSEKHQDYCDNVNEAAYHLLGQINDILDLERLTREVGQMAPEPIEIRSEIERLARMIQPRSAGHEVSLILDIPDDLEIQADRRAFGTIISNLITNAVKYSPDGPKIDLTAIQKDKDHIEIRVRDHGLGIPPEKFSSIFEPFVRVHEADNPTIGGTGLGLPLVRVLVDALGGDIHVESKVGQGTTMILVLPVVFEAEGRTQHPPLRLYGTPRLPDDASGRNI
jgi:signal transduction histidine kinase